MSVRRVLVSNLVKTSLVICAALLLLAILIQSAKRNYSVQAQSTENNKKTFLIRFGIDGLKDVDWSGSISPAPSRMAGWQFEPKDEISEGRWKCTTAQETYWDTPYERSMGPTSRKEKVTAKGILVEYNSAQAGKVQVTTAQGSFTFDVNESLWTAPREFLKGRVEVRSAPATALLSSGPEAEDYPSLLKAKDGALWLVYLGYDGTDDPSNGDQIFVRRRTAGIWSQPEPVTTSRGEYFRTAIAQDRAGKIWVVWAAHGSSNFDLYARAFDGTSWSSVERLTSAPGAEIFHSLISDASGNLYLAYQSSRSGNFDIYVMTYDGRSWSKEIQVSSDPANDWEPALAAAPDGRVTIAWDTYAKGNYDVVARTYRQGKLGPLTPIAESGAFETRASAQYDKQGRLWIAWDEGDWNWGKDYGNLVKDAGRGLMVRRQVRVAVLGNGKLMEPGTSIATSVPEDFRQAFQRPTLALDDQGIPWVFFHYRVNLPQGYRGRTYRALWRMGATSYQNGRWLPMIDFPEGFGRMDAPTSAVGPDGGGLEIAWTTDGRVWPYGFPQEQDVGLASIPATPAATVSQLVPFTPSTENLSSPHPNEEADIARVRSYRTKADGQTLRIVRGDIHRHTDLSWDGNRDGTLEDSYRYAMDAAGFDFLGVCDHQAGESILYHWWMIQKAVDMFTIPGRFAPVYSYERSLPWPNGHRNVVFARKGRPILEISQAERQGKEGAGKLYQYLRRFGGIVTSHTSATGAGTDWRDSDPDLEPVVEIYQGYRNNYEAPDAPRHPPAREEQRFSAGFVWSAWAKGIKLGVQSSSDHVSTHMSYAAVYVDRVDREAIFQALKARHSFAATDNLIVNFYMGGHFMGDIFSARPPIPLKAYIRGTGPLARVSLIKNNRIIYTAPGTGPEMDFTYTDTDTKPGEAYYYIRVEQQDGQLGWSSPMWVTWQ